LPDTDDARLMSGTLLARHTLAQSGRRAARFRQRSGRPPCLSVVLIGNDPASVTYVRMKRARCQDAGITSLVVELDATTTTGEATKAVRSLSEDGEVDGILVQHPLPAHIDERAVFEAIAPDKDIDGVTAHSFGAMAIGVPGFLPCTPAGIIRLLDEYAVDPTGRHAVVLGRSPILGKPMGMLLLARNATVTYCHSYTGDLPALVGLADILVAAVGKPGFVRGEWLKPGSVVIDAGYNEDNLGDVVFDEAVRVASLITPIPGGVGPMTIAILIEQTVMAAELAFDRGS
jgi:methylenetetrahydrofolate dehydrogenase (NADP+)/methenyltetrahydrofolate cyclohydrolase